MIIIIAVTIVEEQYSIYVSLYVNVCIKTVFDLVETPFFPKVGVCVWLVLVRRQLLITRHSLRCVCVCVCE